MIRLWVSSRRDKEETTGKDQKPLHTKRTIHGTCPIVPPEHIKMTFLQFESKESFLGYKKGNKHWRGEQLISEIRYLFNHFGGTFLNFMTWNDSYQITPNCQIQILYKLQEIEVLKKSPMKSVMNPTNVSFTPFQFQLIADFRFSIINRKNVEEFLIYIWIANPWNIANTGGFEWDSFLFNSEHRKKFPFQFRTQICFQKCQNTP